MKKLLMKKYRTSTCQKKMKPVRVESTTKVRDDLVYCFYEEKYFLYQVMTVSEDETGHNVYHCREMNCREKVFTDEASLNFGRIGVFRSYGLKLNETLLRDDEISGKIVALDFLLLFQRICYWKHEKMSLLFKCFNIFYM
jgi:hypothetical protein